jgi:hypothetical protein
MANPYAFKHLAGRSQVPSTLQWNAIPAEQLFESTVKPATPFVMEAYRFSNLISDAQNRIKGGERILRYEPDDRPTYPLEFVGTQ